MKISNFTRLIRRAFRRSILMPFFVTRNLLPGYVNEFEIVVFAQQRSGHHAIVNWLRSNLGKHSTFLNNFAPNTGFPLLDYPNTGFLELGEAATNQKEQSSNRIKTMLDSFRKKECLIYNFEENDLSSFGLRWSSFKRKAYFGKSRNYIIVLILRDPFNLVASKLKWVRSGVNTPSHDYLPTSIHLWKQYAKEYLELTHYFPDSVWINYNFWFSSALYRQELSTQLGLQSYDKGRSLVAKEGPTTWTESSTFDGIQYDGQAEKMKVFDRWREFKTDVQFLELLQDKELLELCVEIFKDDPNILECINYIKFVSVS